MLMGSAMAASLIPSTGLVSEPVSAPEYAKWKVLLEPLAIGVGSVTRTVKFAASRSELSAAPVPSVSDVTLRPLFNSKLTVVRSSSAVKLTSAVAVSLPVAGSRSALMTLPVIFICERTGAAFAGIQQGSANAQRARTERRRHGR